MLVVIITVPLIIITIFVIFFIALQKLDALDQNDAHVADLQANVIPYIQNHPTQTNLARLATMYDYS